MKKVVFLLLFSTFVGHSSAHQFTPTYPKLEQSMVSGVLQAKMELFNRRKEVEYYELEVFDSKWNPLPFASESKLIRIGYLEKKKVMVYIRSKDAKRVEYICTRSKLKKEDTQHTVISSRVCSRVK